MMVKKSLVAFKLGRPSKLKITTCSEEEFEEFEEENYPNINVIWIKEKQIIALERNTAIFSNAELIINSLQDHLNNLLRKYDLSVSIAYLSHMTPFWDCINKYQNRIYEVNFTLYAPNFFGNAQKTTKEMLELARKSYNAEKLDIGISSNQGDINITQDDTQTKNFLLWTGEGGGNWYIRVMSSSGKKATIKSSDSTKSIIVKLDEYSSDGAQRVIDQILMELET